MAAAKKKPRSAKSSRKKVKAKAYARTSMRVKAPKRRNIVKAKPSRPKVAVILPFAEMILEEIAARREVLTNMVSKGLICEETAETRRYVLDYFARSIKARGCKNKFSLRKIAWRLGDKASALHTKPKPPMPNAPSRRRRWLAAYDELRSDASVALTRSLYAGKLYEGITCEPLPARPAVRLARKAALEELAAAA